MKLGVRNDWGACNLILLDLGGFGEFLFGNGRGKMPESFLCLMPVDSDRKKSRDENFDAGKEKSPETAAARAVKVVPRCKSLVPCRRVSPASVSESSVIEKRLPNGDLYIGTFSNSAPHGSGKYLWSDGCMYEGEWKKGKASGLGKFSWPSGATYEGEFRFGCMEGTGTFFGADGDMYIGSWCGNRKHGYGIKHYRNGDYYEGHWKKDLQDGQGRYIWKNGNEFVGEWKKGVINGRCVLSWNNGIQYDGEWENGVPKGHGVFTWPDGGRYIGSWSNDSCKNSDRTQILDGTFYPSYCSKNGNCIDNNGDNDDDDMNGNFCHKLSAPLLAGVAESFDLAIVSDEGKSSSSVEGSAERALPRICIWESEGESGDITCDILGNMETSSLCRDGFVLDRGGIRPFQRRNSLSVSVGRKQPGQTISKGHKNYNLMLNLQLGIRYSVGKPASAFCDLKASDFDPNEKFWTRFPPEGSKTTPPHQSAEFRWKEYCPMVFRHLRRLFQVDPADYMLAICGNDALRELSSPGKSGSFFYLTQDDRFMIKTVKKSEVKVLIKMLPSYYQHVCRYESTLVTKFFGVHCVKPAGGVKTRFIVMGNMFCSAYVIHRRYDLKGSSHGRTTEKPDGEIDETTTLKDLDLDFVFRLQTKWYQELMKQIEVDSEFLEAERIMDYSLLVGLHFREDSTGDKMGLSPFLLRTGAEKDYSFQNEKFMRGCRFLEAELQDMDHVLAGRKPLIRLGVNMPARAERMARRSDFDQYTPGGVCNLTPSTSGETYEVVLYFGIIDILQDYDISKKLEHAYKSWQVNPSSISAVDPKLYSRRFQEFMARIFVEDRRH